jgi:hypothetical protein
LNRYGSRQTGYRDQVIKDAGALSSATMRRIEKALLIVLGIDTDRITP